MFTGIVEKCASVVAVAQGPMFRRLTIADLFGDLKLGQSIAVNGCCLTISQLDPGQMGFDVIAETLNRTNLGLLQAGDRVHLERALAVGDRLDGHFVQGHIDATAPLLRQTNNERQSRLTLEAPDHMVKYLAPKGSIAIDGVSLTIASIQANQFDVALIPTTVQLTTLASRPPGWPFNLEADILAKTIIHYLQTQKQDG